jgi:glycosyltransferase involved in cell wall biosynthesis
MSEPRITVYVPSRNYGRFLGDAIESVLRQSVEDWELIVIDDGSDDETPDIMKLYRGHPKISLHRTEGIGLTAVCNFALARARGRYVIRLDGDDVFDENILLVLGNVLDRAQDVALVFPDYYLVDHFGEIYAQERRQRLYSENHQLDMPPNGACTLVRGAVLREIGGYREDLGAQDGFDLWSKVVARHKCANVNLPLFYYRRHGANLTTDSQRIIKARRRIKKDAAKAQTLAAGPTIAVIPCRRNFDFVPDLWKQEIGGRMLLDRDIESCLSSHLFDHVVITSDSEETASILSKYSDQRLSFVLRDSQSTIRTASIVPTLEMIARKFDPELKGATLVRYLQTPFVTVDTLEEAAETLAMGDADAATGVEEIHGDVFRRTPHGLEILRRSGPLRSDFDNLYRDLLSCVATRNRNLPTGSLTGRSVVSFIVPAAECFSVDSEEKLRIAQIMAGGDS